MEPKEKKISICLLLMILIVQLLREIGPIGPPGKKARKVSPSLMVFSPLCDCVW
jgi:hypothetical protein